MAEADLPPDAPPAAVIDEAERLTRLARDAVDEREAAAYRSDRDDLLAEHDYTARVREEDERAVLVCYPAEWVEDGVVQTERIDDLDRGLERRVAGVADADWERVDAHNRAVVDRIRETHGEPHAATAAALADFMGNHYRKRIEDATRAELEEFTAEYFPRNAFPSAAQRANLEASLRIVADAVDGQLSLPV